MKEVVTYDIYIDEDINNGVDKISLVKKGAILTDFIFMDDLDSQYKQIVLSDEKRIITGPALIPDLAIIRQDSKDEEPYYIKYSSDQIEQIVQKFAKLKTNHNVNRNHKQDVDDTYIYESWMTGKTDKATELGFEVPTGTWMVSMKVEDDEIWDSIKAGRYKGFSIEGLFKFKRSSKLVKQDTDLIHPNCRCDFKNNEFILSDDPCDLCLEASDNFDKTGDFQFEDKKIIKNMISSILKDGNTLYTNAETFDVGSEVYFMDGESTKPVDDGEYTLEDGTVLTITGSTIETITPVVAAEVEAPVVDEVKQAVTLDDLFALLTEVSAKLDALSTTEKTEDTADLSVISKLEAIEVQLEKVIVEKENKNVEAIDNKKNIAQSKQRISYEDMKMYAKKA